MQRPPERVREQHLPMSRPRVLCGHSRGNTSVATGVVFPWTDGGDLSTLQMEGIGVFMSGPEKWSLLQLRVLGAWWCLGSSALEPYLLLQYLPAQLVVSGKSSFTY